MYDIVSYVLIMLQKGHEYVMKKLIMIFIRSYRMLLYLFLFSADDVCPLLNIQNAQLNSTAVSFEEVVLARCKAGFRFPSGATIRVFLCLESGQWNGTVENCRRE